MSAREELYRRYAALTRTLREAADAFDLTEASRVLDARQTLIEETRSLDGADAPLSPAEASVLLAARTDEVAAIQRFEVERTRFVELFQGVARSKRAHGGYASVAAAGAAASDRTA